MPELTLNAAQPARRFLLTSFPPTTRPLAFRSLLARFSLAFHSLFTRFSFALSNYFGIKCIADFYFRFKYVPATDSRAASYAFENKIESRNDCRIKCVARTPKNTAPWNQIPAHRQGIEGGGGPPCLTFVLWLEHGLTGRNLGHADT